MNRYHSVPAGLVLAWLCFTTDTAAFAQDIVYEWVNPDGGDWSVASNWSPAGPPPDGAQVRIDMPDAQPEVRISTANVRVGPLELGDTLRIDWSRNLTIGGPSRLAGTIRLQPGATLTAAGPATRLNLTGQQSALRGNLNAIAGAHISLPDVVALRFGLPGYWQANGTGSAINLPALGTVTVDPLQSWPVKRQLLASDGGTVHAPALTLIQVGGSEDSRVHIAATTGGTISMPPPVALERVSLETDGDSNLRLDSLERMTHATLSLTGRSERLPLLADIDSLAIDLRNGSELVLPAPVTYRFAGGFGDVQLFDASRLSMPAVERIEICDKAVERGTVLYFTAAMESAIELPRLHTIVTVPGASPCSVTISASGSAVIRAPALRSIHMRNRNMYNATALILSEQGTLDAPGLVSMENIRLENYLDGASRFDRLQRCYKCVLVAERGTLELPALTNMDHSTIYAEFGGTVRLPAVETFRTDLDSDWSAFTDALIVMPALRQYVFTANALPNPPSVLNSLSAERGRIELDALETITVMDDGEPTERSVRLRQSQGGVLHLPALQRFEDFDLDGDPSSVTGGDDILPPGVALFNVKLE